jgi:hypothetical protein
MAMTNLCFPTWSAGQKTTRKEHGNRVEDVEAWMSLIRIHSACVQIRNWFIVLEKEITLHPMCER